MYRWRGTTLEVFLGHPGGPFWVRKDLESWTIPKGEYTHHELALDAAKREFQEETGFVPEGSFVSLGEIRQASGKIVSSWAFEGDCDAKQLSSNLFELEWPPKTGKKITIPELDRGAWFEAHAAKRYILPAQRPFLDRLMALLGVSAADGSDDGSSNRSDGTGGQGAGSGGTSD